LVNRPSVKLKAAILAGGLGARLRSVVSDSPKPMAVVGGKPFLVYLLEWLRKQGIHEVVLCVGYRWQDIHAVLGDGASLNMRLQYSVENAPLGTGGALKNAQIFLQDTFLALNGDSFVDIDLKKLVEFHRRKESIATLALTHVTDTGAYGAVDLNDQGKIRNFTEKQGPGAPAGWVNAGVYVLEPDVLSLIPGGKPVSLEQDVFPELVKRNYPIYGFCVKGYFIDIGTPEAYFQSQSELERKI